MGVFALAWPERVVALFGTEALTPEGCNEVRAVYGGFGLAAASVLAWGLLSETLASGIFFALGFSLWGMAAGRIVSVLIDRKAGALPLLLLAVELALGAVLLAASLGLG
jgi:hypothetical protein